MFGGFHGYGSVWYGSAVNNSKVDRYGVVGGGDKVIHDDRLVCGIGVVGIGEWGFRELTRTLYHNETAHFMIPF